MNDKTSNPGSAPRHSGQASIAQIVNTMSGVETVQQWSTRELLDAEFSPLRWIIPSLIPEGLTILAGPPKVGKSWLSMQCASAVGEGGEMFGRPVKAGSALVYALEDNGRRLQSRLRRQGADRTDNVIWRATEWPGWETVEQELRATMPDLVVIDTLARATGGGVDQNDAGQMSEELGPYQRFALDNHISVLVIDHVRKGSEGSLLDRVRGSTAKTATADAILVLQKGAQGATLDVVGRDMEEEVSLLLEFEKTTCLWTVVGDASRPQPSEHEEDLLTAIHELVAQGEIVTTTAVAAKIQRDKGQVSRTMKRLRLAGRLIKGKPIGREQPYLPVDGINGVNGQTSPYGKPLTVDSIDSGGNGIEGRGLFATGKGAIKKVLGLNGNS